MSKLYGTWGYYVLRYFVGTVIGAGLVLLLNSSSFALQGCLPVVNEPYANLAIITAAGFAFCYISSVPVLTVHALRTYTRSLWGRSAVRSWIVGLILGAAAAGGTWTATAGAEPLCIPLTAIVVFLAIGPQALLLTRGAFDRLARLKCFYESLSKARAQQTWVQRQHGDNKIDPWVEEYVESYRHLREHGNAFFILLMEVLLAFVLYHLSSRQYALLLLLGWILPGVACWFIGTCLEMRLSDT